MKGPGTSHQGRDGWAGRGWQQKSRKKKRPPGQAGCPGSGGRNVPPGQTVLQLPSRGGLSAWTPVWGAVGEGRLTRVAGSWPWLGLQPPPLSGLRAGKATLANGQASGSSQLEPPRLRSRRWVVWNPAPTTLNNRAALGGAGVHAAFPFPRALPEPLTRSTALVARPPRDPKRMQEDLRGPRQARPEPGTGQPERSPRVPGKSGPRGVAWAAGPAPPAEHVGSGCCHGDGSGRGAGLPAPRGAAQPPAPPGVAGPRQPGLVGSEAAEGAPARPRWWAPARDGDGWGRMGRGEERRQEARAFAL